jgi:hypothetical protein
MKGICALCLNAKVLCMSHYLPAGFYRHIMKTDTIPTSDLIAMNAELGTTISTSTQARKYLLCSGCEQHFGKYGENPVASFLQKYRSTFKLRDILLNAPADMTKDGKRIWFGRNMPQHAKASAFLYLMTSIVWRGSITDWGLSYNGLWSKLSCVRSKNFRKYLLGRVVYPQRCKLYVYVNFDATDDVICGMMSVPSADRIIIGDAYLSSYAWVVPGLRLVLLVDDNYLVSEVANCRPDDLVTFCEWSPGVDLYREIAEHMSTTKPKGKLAGAW